MLSFKNYLKGLTLGLVSMYLKIKQGQEKLMQVTKTNIDIAAWNIGM